MFFFFFSSRRRHTRCALVTGVQTCALPIFGADRTDQDFTAIGQADLLVPRGKAIAGAHAGKIASMTLKNPRRREERVFGTRVAHCPANPQHRGFAESRTRSMAGSGDSTRAIFFDLGANFTHPCAHVVAAFFTGSSAMLADNVTPVADGG